MPLAVCSGDSLAPDNSDMQVLIGCILFSNSPGLM